VVLQAAIEAERANTQALLAERDRQTAKLLEEERNRNMMATRALYEMFAVIFFCMLAKSCT
jgi:hypothetical protein